MLIAGGYTSPIIRWKVVEKEGTGRNLFFYSRVWDKKCINSIREVLGHEQYSLMRSGHLDEYGKLVDVPSEDECRLITDHAPARETRT